MQGFGLDEGVGVTSGDDEMIVMSASLAAALWDCIYMWGCEAGGFSAWARGVIGAGGCDDSDNAGTLVTPKVTARFPKCLARSDLEGPSSSVCPSA